MQLTWCSQQDPEEHDDSWGKDDSVECNFECIFSKISKNMMSTCGVNDMVVGTEYRLICPFKYYCRKLLSQYQVTIQKEQSTLLNRSFFMCFCFEKNILPV